jgi:transposase
MTSELFNTLWADLQDPRSKRDIAHSNCVTEAIVDSVIDCLVMEHPSCLPETLCIDEFKGSSGIWDSGARKWKKPGDYHCNIANGDNGYVLDILPKHDKASLQEYFRRFPLSERQQVKYFTCDMHGGYIPLAKQTFPNAIICIDMFHVVKLLNERMDEIRNILQNEFRDNGDEASYQLLKRSRLMLITAEANQRAKWKDKYADRQDRLKKIFEIAPDIEVAYDAQEFHHILRTDLYGLQHSLLSNWIRKYSSSEAPKVRSVAHTIRRHKGYILNSFRYHKSNAPCEGLNNKIKVLKRNAYGFHSFEDFRKRILLACGNTKLVKEIHTMKDRKGGSKS